MLQNNMENLVHHHKIQFGIAEFVHKIRAEIDSLPIRRGGFTVLVDCIGHVHQKQPIESVAD